MARNNKKATLDMERTLVAMLRQPTLLKAAKDAGVSYSTLWRRLKDPAFQAAWRERRLEAVAQAVAQLQLSSNEVMTVLRKIILDPEVNASTRSATGRDMLKMALRSAETEDFQARLQGIEQKLKEAPSPEDNWKNWAPAYRCVEYLEEHMPTGLDLPHQIQYRALAAAFSPGEHEQLAEYVATQADQQISISDLPPDLAKARNRLVRYLDDISFSVTGKPWPELVKKSTAKPKQIGHAGATPRANGKNADQEIWKIDGALVAHINDSLNQAAAEAAQWTEKREQLNPNISIVFVTPQPRGD